MLRSSWHQAGDGANLVEQKESVVTLPWADRRAAAWTILPEDNRP